MNASDYQFINTMLLETSGLFLGTGKEYLVESRLFPVARSMDLPDVSALVARLKSDSDEKLISLITEAMTTNETSFFRDKYPFRELTDVLLPELIDARKQEKKLRIWCAAVSTGQEAYSVAMQIRESHPELSDWDIEILATDIDRCALARSMEGIYSQFEIQRGLPIQYLMKYFEQVERGWQVKAELRDSIRWQKINLLSDIFRFEPFDIVFCRNVLIYFETKTKGEILERIGTTLRPDGFLYLGAAETVIGISQAYNRFKECRSAVYRLNREVVAGSMA